MAEGKYEAPKETAGDLAHAVGRSLLGAIPSFGQAGIELFTSIIVPPIERRRDEWRHEIGEAIKRLEEQKRCVVEELKHNDTFIDTLLQASQAAIRTSQREKREALRNAVLNAALPDAPEEARQSIFIHFIDGCTSLHMRLLSLLDDPRTWFERHEQDMPNGPPKTLWPLVTTAFPDLADQEVLCERVCTELHEKGLLIASSLREDVARFPFFPKQPREQQVGYRFLDELPSHGTVPYSANPTSLRNWTTELGRQFLEFIASPINESRTLGAGRE